jgi:uncharacterized protein YbcI
MAGAGGKTHGELGGTGRQPGRSVAKPTRTQAAEDQARDRRRLWIWPRGPQGPARSPAARPAGGEHAAEISGLVSRLVAQHLGRRPRTRTYLGHDVIAVVLEDALTDGERRLVREGMSELVLSTRAAFQQTMREDLIAGIEEITGRKVRASTNETRPDIALETLVLDGSRDADTARGGR